jgi:glycerol-3-phosphate dehydrogenase (NAD(P)+)
MSFERIGIVGAGSWGTALALLLAAPGRTVTVWGHDAVHLERMRQEGENAAYLPGIRLPEDVRWSAELEDLAGSELVVVVVPSKAMREVSARLSTVGVRRDAVLLSCTKGVERGSGLRMSEILEESFPGHPVAVLSGPSHAEEVALKRPTAVVLGSRDAAVGRDLQKAFSTPFFRAYTSLDVAGIELGGALKNVFAIAAGVGDGLGLGDNSKAALVTRALAELVRLGAALGGQRDTFYGLSGLGDLMVTCFSRHSRNRAVGERLGRGETLPQIIASMSMVAEGVPTTFSAVECARRHGIETPIIDQMRALLDGEIRAGEALTALLNRDPKSELG